MSIFCLDWFPAHGPLKLPFAFEHCSLGADRQMLPRLVSVLCLQQGHEHVLFEVILEVAFVALVRHNIVALRQGVPSLLQVSAPPDDVINKIVARKVLVLVPTADSDLHLHGSHTQFIVPVWWASLRVKWEGPPFLQRTPPVSCPNRPWHVTIQLRPR